MIDYIKYTIHLNVTYYILISNITCASSFRNFHLSSSWMFYYIYYVDSLASTLLQNNYLPYTLHHLHSLHQIWHIQFVEIYYFDFIILYIFIILFNSSTLVGIITIWGSYGKDLVPVEAISQMKSPITK